MIIVTIMSCIERGLGFGYRIFLSRSIGAEGLGLYQIALSVVGVIITLSASGIPITVSRLMIKQQTNNNANAVNQTVSSGILTCLLVCIPICLVFSLFNGTLDLLFADNRCNALFLIVVPGIILTSVYAVIRGFFWGTKSFYTYSIIELLEEMVMIVAGIVAISLSSDFNAKTKWASGAVLISYVFSFITASVIFYVKGGRLKNPLPQLKTLLTSSVPITLMRASGSLTNSLIALILPASLILGGLTRSQAVSEFGVLSGMSLPLLFIPSTIIGSISLVMVPEMSENFYKKNTELIRNNVEKALLYSSIITIFIIPIFVGIGRYIGVFIYNNYNSGVYLSIAAPIMLPMSVTMISTSLLNSMGMEKNTLKYYLIGACFLVLSIWILPRFLGIYSLIIGYFLSFSITAVSNLALLNKICCKKLDFYKKTTCAVVVCALSTMLCFFSYSLLYKFIPQFLSAFISAIVTLTCVYVSLRILSVIDFSKKENKALS